jgi:beta-galactosidase
VVIWVESVRLRAEFLANKEVLDYRGSQVLGTSWFGGNYFVKDNPYFTKLPVDCAFNWEYQSLATYNKNRYGLRLYNGETLVGCISDHKKEVYSAFSVIPAGRGKIIITSLDLFSCLQDLKANIVAQQLLLNILTLQ